MKKLFAILPLLALCSCLSPQKTPVPPPAPPPTPDLNPMHAKLVIAPQPKFTTNILHWQWTAPDQVGLTSYKFYYGTNSRSYVGVYQLGSDTNFYMTNIDLLLDTNTWDTATTYQDGQTYTNVANTYVAITAQYDAITVADFGFTTALPTASLKASIPQKQCGRHHHRPRGQRSSSRGFQCRHQIHPILSSPTPIVTSRS